VSQTIQTLQLTDLPGASHDEIKQFNLRDFTEEGLVILSFYPFDFSPICTDQLCGMRDIEWFQMEDTVDVFGISCDSAYAHRRFIQEHDLPFPLLSDFSADFIEQFGIKQAEFNGHRDVAKRSIFVLNSDEEIVYQWIRDAPTEKPPMKQISTEIQQLL
jgi:peroxiredoxin